jgi:exodeoxyribonuclease III
VQKLLLFQQSSIFETIKNEHQTKKVLMALIISYNVNGIRSAMNKGLLGWLAAVNPDVVCLQEIKANPEQIDLNVFKTLGYNTFWFPAQKKGYSGVAIFSKQKPLHVEYGVGINEYDSEGRTIRADFEKFSVMSAYFPSGTTGDERQSFKMKFLGKFIEYATELKKKHSNIIIAGDYNICHKPIDIHNPVSNANSSGFLPEEREWVTQFLERGFTDSFRLVNSGPHNYTWWSFRANSRANNKGWRIDYQMVSKNFEKAIKRATILPEAKHSDHCPTLLEINTDY